MIWILVRKELLTNLLTLRLGIAVIFTVVLAVLTTFIGSLDYSRNIEAYGDVIRESQEELNQATVFQQVRPRVIVPPLPSSVLCRGTLGTAGQQIRISVDNIHEWGRGLFATNDSGLMKSLVQIDFATVVALLLSFLAVVMGFDGICGERERGTLKQLMANSVPRGTIVLSKLVGGLISVWIPFGLAFIVSLLIMLANPDINFNSEDWLRLVMLFILGCLFLRQVFSLSLMVSTFTRDSDTSLIICLFAWLVGGVAYVNALPSFSRYGVPETPFQVFLDRQDKLYEDFDKEMEQWEERNPRPDRAYMEGIWNNGRLRYAHPRGYAWMQKRNEVALEKRVDIASRKNKFRREHQKHLKREAYIVDEGSIFSPITNFQVLSYQLAQTTLDDAFFSPARSNSIVRPSSATCAPRRRSPVASGSPTTRPARSR